MANEAKHTPGPWKVSDENCGGGRNIVDAAGRRVAHTAEFFNAKMEPVSGPEAAANALLVAAAPRLAEVVQRLCVQLASAGIEADAGSNNPLESLHADALAAYREATDIDNPFAVALGAVCADNRAAIAKAEGR